MRRIHKVQSRVPHAVFIKSKPFDPVLKLFLVYAGIQDLLNFPFFIIIDLNRFR